MRDIYHLDRSIEDRMVTFDSRPDDEQLGTDLGYGLIGKDVFLEDDGQLMRVLPQAIPVKAGTIWMYFVVTALAIAFVFLGVRDPIPWFLLAMGAVIIIPLMMSVLWWLDKEGGDEAYLVFDRSTGVVELPRVSLRYPVEQLREIVFLDRWIEGDQFWQCALLVEKDGSWTYVHLFNGGGGGLPMFGVKGIYQKIGEVLGIKSRRLRFTRAQSKSLS